MRGTNIETDNVQIVKRNINKKLFLFLDVDGVLNLFDYDYSRQEIIIEGVYLPVSFPENCAEYLRTLNDYFQVVWATAWFEDANLLLKELDLEFAFPVLEWSNSKLSAILDYTDAPFVFIDDEIRTDQSLLQKENKKVTENSLLLETNPQRGLGKDEIEKALLWHSRINF